MQTCVCTGTPVLTVHVSQQSTMLKITSALAPLAHNLYPHGTHANYSCLFYLRNNLPTVLIPRNIHAGMFGTRPRFAASTQPDKL